MKSVLISIQPKWCELIASGKKTVEVRKTAPKEVPFKAYIYATKPKARTHPARIYNSYIMPESGKCGSGKVIGEFICDKIYIFRYQPAFQDYDFTEIYKDNNINDYFSLKKTCLTQSEICDYGKGKPLYGLHISELKIYDEPRELSEFKICKVIRGYHKKTEKNDTFKDKIESLKHSKRVEVKIITRPPQSWCYVENSSSKELS